MFHLHKTMPLPSLRTPMPASWGSVLCRVGPICSLTTAPQTCSESFSIGPPFTREPLDRVWSPEYRLLQVDCSLPYPFISKLNPIKAKTDTEKGSGLKR